MTDQTKTNGRHCDSMTAQRADTTKGIAISFVVDHGDQVIENVDWTKALEILFRAVVNLLKCLVQGNKTADEVTPGCCLVAVWASAMA